jgi:hypothetical protein
VEHYFSAQQDTLCVVRQTKLELMTPRYYMPKPACFLILLTGEPNLAKATAEHGKSAVSVCFGLQVYGSTLVYTVPRKAARVIARLPS